MLWYLIVCFNANAGIVCNPPYQIPIKHGYPREACQVLARQYHKAAKVTCIGVR